MFTDRVKLRIRAGKGGNGLVSWRREPYLPKGGPAGGNGGMGGSVYIEANDGSQSLDHLANKKLIKAGNGCQGGKSRRNGRQGTDYLIKVPAGTLVKTKNKTIDLSTTGERHLLCEGGKGGLGNAFFKSSRHQAPNKATPGKNGQEQEVELELKLIADIGLVGMPNAGKTTLLSALTKNEFKSGDYPFTTLYPNLGEIHFEDYTSVRIADIPGIIKNAHKNKGLGLEFLRHIERCKCLVFVLDATSDSFEEDFHALEREIKAYNQRILEKPTLIVLNKSDLCKRPKTTLMKTETIWTSAVTLEGINTLRDKIHKFSHV